MSVPDDPRVMLPLLRFAAARGGEIFAPEVVRHDSPACRQERHNKGRFWLALALTIGLTVLLAWAAAAEGAKSTSASNAVSLSQASGLPYTTYLPAVFAAYPGCTTKPTLISPANGSNLSTITPLYVWDNGDNPAATAFRLQVSTNAAFTNQVGNLRWGIHEQTEFRFSANLDPSTTYYWRAYLECGNMRGPYSDVWTFTTGAGGTVLPAPALVAPADGAAVPGRMVTLQWSPVPGAVDYLVRWRMAGESGYSYDWIQGTQKPDYFSASSTYEWWVSARNDYAIGTDSETWQFTTPAVTSLGSTQGPKHSFVVGDGDASMVVEQEDGK
jgi:hypothetical protein